MEKAWDKFNAATLSGRNRRLLNEWIGLDELLAQHPEMDYSITGQNAVGLPNEFLITYRIRSICGVEHVETLSDSSILHAPVFASLFKMRIQIPANYPSIDAPIDFRFLCSDADGNPIPHPWHPNIRYFGEFAGRVCLNPMNTFASLAWSVERVGLYLRYELYHAWQEPPYPEDTKVAQWVIQQGEPHEWVFFDQDELTEMSGK